VEDHGIEDLRLKRVEHEVVRHERVGSLEEAAALRGVDPSAVLKTMVVRKGEGSYLFVLVPGHKVIDWPKLRGVLGGRRLSMPDPDEAQDVTGYVRGTITPLGSTHDWPVVADTLAASGTVSVGGGAPGLSITLKGKDLVEILNALVADVTKNRQ
jgi:Cys-tRNA(Pro) deacylase